MSRKVLFISLLIILMLSFLTGCRSGMNSDETQKETIEAPTAVSHEEKTESEEETAEEEKQPYSNKGLVKSQDFGKYVAPEVQKMNEKTLITSESGIVDLSRLVLNVSDVLNMINSYQLPDTVYYGGEPVNETVRNELTEYRNLDGLEERQSIGIDSINREFGILIRNSDVRSFPTDLKAADTTDDKAFDLFQETEFLYGTGVMILHRTIDREWAFVQGENYYGWIHSDDIALCDSETCKNYQSPDHFIISNGQAWQPGDDSSRLGVIIPLRVVGDEVMMVLPGKSANGRFFEDLEVYEKKEGYHEGYYPYDDNMPGTAAELFRALEGTPYGWGDRNGYYDCSSSVGLILRLFGIMMPRNSSDFRFSGAERIDISGMTDNEKYDIINRLTGAVLLMPGHVMMAAGENAVIHCGTAYYTAPGGEGLTEKYCINTADLTNMYKEDGSSFTSALTDVFIFR